MKKTINIRPQTDVYSTYRRLSYQHWSALAEFVDNSTQSFYDNKEKLYETKFYKGLQINIDYSDNEIIITDNAFGMDWSDFIRAINLHKPPQKVNGRNEFGMGLKTAACWYSSLWTIETTRLGSDKKYTATIDVDMLEKYKNEEIEVEEEYVNTKEHYTIVTLKKLNQKITGSMTKSKIKNLLSSTYRQDIRSGEIEIVFKGEILQFNDPLVFEENVNGEKKNWKEEIEFDVYNDNKKYPVKGFIGIRIPGSLKEAGFTLLRHGRVIVGGSEKNYRPPELFGDSNSYAYQRMFGELHMNDWPATQAKDAFNWDNNGLEESFINELKKYTQKYKIKSEDIRIPKKIKVEKVGVNLTNQMQSSPNFSNASYEILNNETPQEDNEEEVENFDASQNPTNSQNEKQILKIPFEYKCDPYTFYLEFDYSNPHSQWLKVKDCHNGVYELKLNLKHAFFEEFIDSKEYSELIAKISFAMILAEVRAETTSSDGRIDVQDIRVNMNQILQDISSKEIANG